MKKAEAEKLVNELMEAGFNAGWRAEPYRSHDITVRVYGRGKLTTPEKFLTNREVKKDFEEIIKGLEEEIKIPYEDNSWGINEVITKIKALQNVVINRELVKILLKQVNDHSSKICHLIDELKVTWGSVGSPADKKVDELKEEIAIQNECIQDILVSFTDLYLSR